MSNTEIELLRRLAGRLERLSVDSHCARRASGIRGNLIRVIEEIDSGRDVESARFSVLIQHAFEILRQAAQEIPDSDEIMKK